MENDLLFGVLSDLRLTDPAVASPVGVERSSLFHKALARF